MSTNSFLPGLANITVADGGSDSYFDVTVNDSTLQGDYEAWCVDKFTDIDFKNYTANVYSSYETIPTGLVDQPQNLDLVNWIINQDYTDGIYNEQDVQEAIWILVDSQYTTTDAEGIFIANQALANGEGFIPDFDDTVAVILAPFEAGEKKQTLIIEDEAEPGIDIRKLTNGEDAASPEDAVKISTDGVIDWSFEVTNTGNIPFQKEDVKVLDLSLDNAYPYFDVTSDIGGDGLLSPGEVWTYTFKAEAEDLSQSGNPYVTWVEGETVTIDFETDGAGNPLAAGTLIDDEYADVGVTVTTNDFANHPTMIFDGANPTGNDQDDLDVPEEGNILIISQDGNSANPNDYWGGGTIELEFDDPVTDFQLRLYDIDEQVNGPEVTIKGYQTLADGSEQLIDQVDVEGGSGDGFVPDVDLLESEEGFDRIEITLEGSGAITGLEYTPLEPIFKNVATVEVVSAPGVTDSDSSYYVNIEAAIAPPPLPVPIAITNLLPEVVNFTLSDGGNDSYFDLTFDTSLLTETYESWCVDLDTFITVGNSYTADVYSSYETLPEGLVERPENLDLVNWIINQDYLGQGYSSDDIQDAIWTLVEFEGDFTPNTSAQVIVDEAIANGEGFVPDVDDSTAVIFDPRGDFQIIIGEIKPDIEIKKFTNGADAATPGEAIALTPGELINWTFEVSNTGNLGFNAEDVLVRDDTLSHLYLQRNLSTDVGDDNILSPGETWTYFLNADALDLAQSATANAILYGMETVKIDFDTDAAGDALAAGTVIDDEYAAVGMTVTASNFVDHPTMIFDGANPTGNDEDLFAPDEGNMLILSQNGNSADPNDYWGGGTIQLDFDDLVNNFQVGLFDIDESGAGPEVRITGYRSLTNGSYEIVSSIDVEGGLGEGFRPEVDVLSEAGGFDRVEIWLRGSGAITDLEFERLLPVYGNTASVQIADLPGLSDTDSSYYFNGANSSSPLVQTAELAAIA